MWSDYLSRLGYINLRLVKVWVWETSRFIDWNYLRIN
jgi:hypothetical protein